MAKAPLKQMLAVQGGSALLGGLPEAALEAGRAQEGVQRAGEKHLLEKAGEE